MNKLEKFVQIYRSDRYLVCVINEKSNYYQYDLIKPTKRP